ncbi:hypothetical protein RND81_03G205300 [Saponaria officinalis]|uniref:RING-type E3 ubiquitin transferase n=1 Tax=Saponaria officinalis TaxID=3572 RepID=A0AAW1M1K8_SAPOF
MSSTDGAVTAPFLTGESSRQRSSEERGGAEILWRASSRRMMSDQSLRVRQSAARLIQERRSSWAYSTPIVVVDLIWNAVIVLISIVVIQLSGGETAQVPLRVWIVGYGLLCVFHMICVCIEYRRRRVVVRGTVASIGPNLSSNLSLGSSLSSNLSSSSSLSADFVDYVPQRRQNEDETSAAKYLESASRILSFMWWIIGFYWISSGGQMLADNAPKLYWLTTVFLIFDVIVVVICVVVACILGIAVCCCLPFIIAIMYTVADQEGASNEEIERLKKYRFRSNRAGEIENIRGEIQQSDGGILIECDTETPLEKPLSAADAACSICLDEYDDESEIRELPCFHHFHCACIGKWLRSKPTCPLCKNNILENDDHNSNEV